MSTATYAARGRGRSAADGESGSPGLFWGAVVTGVVLLALIVAWLFGWLRFTTDPRVMEIVKLQESAREKFTANGGPQTVEEATAAFTAMREVRERVEALPEHLRPQAMQAMGGGFRSQFRQRIDDYFQAPPTERKAVLDRQIDQEELFRKAMQASGGVPWGPPGGGGSPGGGSASGGPPGGGPPGGGPPQGGPPRTGGDDGRNRWFKGIIDRTSPEQRARYTEYRRAIDERRKERGLETGWRR